MAETPYVYEGYPKVLWFADGMQLLVQTPEEAAKYPDAGEHPDGPFDGVGYTAPESPPAPEAPLAMEEPSLLSDEGLPA